MSERVVGKTRYRNPTSDVLDQALFFILFAIGAASIWTLKDIGRLSELEVTAVPVSLMLLYAIISLITKRFRMREDKVGENIYYLGFLYTLTSLAYALHAYNPNGSGATAIITGFGVAIFTTIIGLAGRVLFNQMRDDPVEYEREARHSLAEASSAVRSELSDIATEMSTFKHKIVQITEEGVVDVSNIARELMAENVSRFASAAEDVIEKIQTAFSSFTDHSSRLNEIAEKNVTALQALFDRIEHIEASPDLFAAKLDPIVEAFSEIATEARRRNTAQTRDLKRMHEMIEAMLKSAELVQKSMAVSDERIESKLQVVD